MSPTYDAGMASTPERQQAGQRDAADRAVSASQARPLTYDAAESVYRGDLATARERYEELTGRDLCVRSAALLRERGQFDPDNIGAQALAAAEPLVVAERLELLAIGEVLARYYRHPSMLDHAAKGGASWEEIGAARGTSADQARQAYRDWAEGQHNLLSWTAGRLGMSDAEYAEAVARADAPDPETPGYPKAYAAAYSTLCAHADEDGRDAHWLAPGEKCDLETSHGSPDLDPEGGQ